MTRWTSRVWAGVVLCILLSAVAGAELGGIAVAPKVSTLGLGGEVIVGLAKGVNARGGINALNVDFDATVSDIGYKAKVDLLSYSLLVDWHLLGGPFRVTGGALVNENKATLISRPSETVVVGGTSYQVADVGTVTGKAAYDREIAPYLGIGWGNALASKGRFGLMVDVGAVYTDAPKITLTADGPLASDTTFQQSLAQEQRDAQGQASRFRFYPVLGLSLYFRF